MLRSVVMVAASVSMIAGVGLAAPAAAAVSTGAPAGWYKDCRKLVQEGSAKKCLRHNVTYGARCKKRQHLYVGRCYVDVYGAWTSCTCYGPAMDGKWYWNAPE